MFWGLYHFLKKMKISGWVYQYASFKTSIKKKETEKVTSNKKKGKKQKKQKSKKQISSV